MNAFHEGGCPPGLTSDVRLVLHVAALWHRQEARRDPRPSCPRCGQNGAVRWGSFGGRQRHRCRTCGRTFSSFTGTPFEGSRKPGLWVTFAECMARGDSVRRSAATCGIAPSTAFRWRHALLRSEFGKTVTTEASVGDLHANPAPRGPGAARRTLLPGTVACREFRIAESFKGRTPSGRATRARAVPWGSRFLAGRRSWVLVLASARSIGSRALICRVVLVGTMLRTPGPSVLGDVRDGHIHGKARLASSRALRWTRFAKAPLFSRREAAQGVGAGRPARLAAGLVRARLRDWLVRFRGVATRYLEHYLAWFSACCDLFPGEGDPCAAACEREDVGAREGPRRASHGLALLLALVTRGDIHVDRWTLREPA
jgi:transposase-like protein